MRARDWLWVWVGSTWCRGQAGRHRELGSGGEGGVIAGSRVWPRAWARTGKRLEGRGLGPSPVICTDPETQLDA